MTDNPYYQLLALIRAQQVASAAQFFIARLEQLSPPVFSAGEAEVCPRLTAGGLTLTQADLQAAFLCLWLEGQVLLLCRLDEASWR